MKLALIGDVHGQWDTVDSEWFNHSDYDGVLLTGDLPGRSHADLIDVARRISTLRLPAVLIPGNHDGPSSIDVLREAVWNGISAEAADRMVRVVRGLEEALGPVRLGGYSVHRMGEVDVIAARPHAMDDRKLTFRPALRELHGVDSLEASAARLRACVDEAERPIVFLAHNGPAGFGRHRTDPWGLHGFGRDNGDPDLSEAVAYALEKGRQVLAVVTGHMHWNSRKPRVWQLRRDGVLYVNAARVPRVSRGLRRHVALEILQGVASARLVELPRAEPSRARAGAGRGA